MSFNIEWGGDNISFDKVVEAVRVSNADIIGIQEPVGNLQRLATELGWYFDEQTYVISRFPVLRAPDADGKYVFVEIVPGEYVAVASIHIYRFGNNTDPVFTLDRTVSGDGEFLIGADDIPAGHYAVTMRQKDGVR